MAGKAGLRKSDIKKLYSFSDLHYNNGSIMNNRYSSNLKGVTPLSHIISGKKALKTLALVSIMGLGGLIGFFLHGILGSSFGLILGYVIAKLSLTIG